MWNYITEKKLQNIHPMIIGNSILILISSSRILRFLSIKVSELRGIKTQFLSLDVSRFHDFEVRKNLGLRFLRI
jgi:hypothetical protein